MDSTTTAILDAARSYRDEMARLTRALVSIATENPPGRLRPACIDLLARAMRELGLEPEVLEAPAPPAGSDESRRCTLLGLYGRGRGDATLYFHGHYDVVPASRAGQFDPTGDDDRIVGRGSADMKSGLVAMLYAVRLLKEAGADLRGRIGLVFVPDEETGGGWGSQFLADRGVLGRDGVGMLTAEPTSGAIWNTSRGAISLRVTVRGRSTHVGEHYRGVNAFEGLVAVANALLALKPEIERRETALVTEPGAARRSILLVGGECRGGSNFNTMPAECAVTVDRRINPEEDLEQEKQRLLATIDRVRAQGIDLSVDVFQEGRAASVPADHAFGEALARSVSEVTGARPAFAMCPGLLETRFYAARGVPGFAYGPGRLEVSHGPLECVEVDRIVDAAAVYALTAVRVLA